jgi:triphosphoribosyl-dephospho-CoA synthase
MKVDSERLAVQPSLIQISQGAVRALHAELALEPKPGLVSCQDNGSHADMNASTLFKSLFALRGFFGLVARAGWQTRPLADLQSLGLLAEARMLKSTGGINTHRGAIFSLGLLCAAGGLLAAQRSIFSPIHLRQVLLNQWGEDLRLRAAQARRSSALCIGQLSIGQLSNGQRVAQLFQLRSAHEEAAEGFPTLFEVALPALQDAIASGLPPRAAKVHCLFATMAALDDTNVAHRGGREAIDFVKGRATGFIESGSVWQPDWLSQARHIHAEFVERRLSPGGAADMLACACWVQEMESLAGQDFAVLKTRPIL